MVDSSGGTTMENNNNNNNNNSHPPEDVIHVFKQKAAFMKTWKPANLPSNRDRLELYSLHKQAVTGDAPTAGAIEVTSAAEKAKYNAWKSKVGLSPEEAMRRYVAECNRQIQMYGSSSSNTSAAAAITDGKEQAVNHLTTTNNTNTSAPTQNTSTSSSTPTTNTTSLRGLAAIPLLCAAASEGRQAYLRRLYHTSLTNSWWRRQEPLTAAPGSLAALPEHFLLKLAATVEYISLQANEIDKSKTSNTANKDQQHNDASTEDETDELLPNDNNNNNNLFLALLPPAAVIQSFFWPLHNCLLAAWMEFILIHAVLTGAVDSLWTVLWGSRNTGKTLSSIWNSHISLAAIQSVNTVTEYHQPIAARCVGLLLWPATLLVQTITIITTHPDEPSSESAEGGRSSNPNTARLSYAAAAAASTNAHTNANNNANTANTTTTTQVHATVWTCLLYSTAIAMTWWYWIAVLPWISMVSLIVVFWVGGSCFALIELAGV